MKRRDDLKAVEKIETLTAYRDVSREALALHGDDPRFIDSIKHALKHELMIAFTDFRTDGRRRTHLNLFLGDFMYKKHAPEDDVPEFVSSELRYESLLPIRFMLCATVYTDNEPRKEDDF